MGLLNNKPTIRQLALQLEYIERELQRIENDNTCLPSPIDMKFFIQMRCTLPRLVDYTNMLDKKLWERIRIWRNTPYTPAQLLINKILEFTGWWFVVSIVISQCLLSWFWSLFPDLWQLPATGMVIGLVLVMIMWSEEWF